MASQTPLHTSYNGPCLFGILVLGCRFLACAADKFICALTRKIVRDPVVAANGLTYEKADIVR